MYILRSISGRIQDFKLGDGLKKIRPSGGRRENVWGISCEKSRFPAKKLYFFQFYGEGAPGTPPGSVPGASIQKLINIDRSKTGRNCGINLKDVIELCHIF